MLGAQKPRKLMLHNSPYIHSSALLFANTHSVRNTAPSTSII
jgi:hypothetical protein